MKLFSKSVALMAAISVSVVLSAADINLPTREGARPKTTNSVPHVQIDFAGTEELSAQLSKRVANFPGVNLGPTRVSLPGAVGFQLGSDVPLARPEAIVGGLEFAHLHPDGSLHASLEPNLAVAAIEAGWATAHPWANQRGIWEGFVMIYSPTNAAELDVVTQLVEESYTFITGQSPSN